jgi:hypothetical protein
MRPGAPAALPATPTGAEAIPTTKLQEIPAYSVVGGTSGRLLFAEAPASLQTDVPNPIRNPVRARARGRRP